MNTFPSLVFRAARDVAAAVPGAAGDAGGRRESDEGEQRSSKRAKVSQTVVNLAV